MPDSKSIKLMDDNLFNHLDVAIALADPASLKLLDHNEHFSLRCLNDVDSDNVDIKTIFPTLKPKVLQKALERNRRYRHNQVFNRQGVEFPVDFVFSSVNRDGKDYILIQGVDNRHALEMKSMVNSYDQIFKAQTEELTQEKEKSQAASQAKSQFLSRMSHELRTPLNAILGFAQVQAIKLANIPEPLKNNEYILNGGFQLLELIEKMFDFVEMEDHKVDVQINSCDLNQCINEAIELCADLVLKYQVSVNYQPTELKVSADHERVTQTFKELLTNAIKYNKSGGTVTIEVSKTDAGQIDIAFEDTGVGMTAEEQDKLFEPFFRTAHAEKCQIPGIGIGLVLCQKVARMMNGEIYAAANNTLDGSNDEGMTFFLSLSQG